MSHLDDPTGCTAAALATDPADGAVLSVLTRRTYRFAPDGGVRLADEQLPLRTDGELEARDDRPAPVTRAEPDIWPVKLATDVVVLGTAYAPGGRLATHARAEVAVGRHAKAIDVLGDRRVEYTAGRPLRFTPPEPFAAIPLTYFRAYGGIDPSVLEEPDPETLGALLMTVTPEDAPGAYARNPAGVGYVVRECAAVLRDHALPNFEDPRHRLAPERLVVNDPAQWWRMPLPQGFGWFDAGWYPRAAFVGVVPRFAPPDGSDAVEEVRAGAVPRGMCERLAARAPGDERLDPRVANGASSGLIVPWLRGDEPVRLTGLTPEGDARFTLPGDAPDVAVTYRSRALEPLRRVLHTVLLEPDARRVSLVWSTRVRLPAGFRPPTPRWSVPDPDPLDGFEVRTRGRGERSSPAGA